MNSDGEMMLIEKVAERNAVPNVPLDIKGLILVLIERPHIGRRQLLHSAHTVSYTHLLVIPIKENNHSGDRLGRTVDPLSSIFEPLDACLLYTSFFLTILCMFLLYLRAYAVPKRLRIL